MSRAVVVRLALGYLVAGWVLVGVWAQLFPASFHESFPGLGRAWVRFDGPFNEHLVRDVGGLNLALAVVGAAAWSTLLRPLVLATGVGSLAYGLPHLAYHAHHFDEMEAIDAVGNVLTLGGNVMAAAVLVVLSSSTTRWAAVSSRSTAPRAA